MSSEKRSETLGQWHSSVEPTSRQRPQLRQVLSILPILGILSVGLLWLFAGLRPVCRTEFVPLWMGGPSSGPLPSLPWADQDRDALSNTGLFRVTRASLGRTLNRGEVIDILRGLPADDTTTTLVVYLAGPACRDAQGRVHILPPGSDLADPATWLPLRQILATLHQIRQRHKLLVLDIACPAESPGIALVTADATAGINEELAAEPDPARLVLMSCAAGQVSQYSEVLGQSVFSHYFTRAICGEADGVRGSRDGQVTAGEVADYVRDRVSRWALHARLACQEPTLVGKATDFPVVTLPKNRPASADALGQRVYPVWLLEAWRKWTSGSSPESIHIGRALLAAERGWRSGDDPDRLKTVLLKALAATPTPAIAASPPPQSLARAVMARAEAARAEETQTPETAETPFDPSLVDRLEQLQLELDARTRDQPAEQAGKIREALKTEFLTAVQKRPLLDVACAVMERTYRLTDPRPETLAVLVELLDALEPEPRFVETLALRRVAAACVSEVEVKSGMLREILQVIQVGEQAAAHSRSSPWVHNLREEAARKRHEAEVLLMTPGRPFSAMAESLLDQSLSGYSAVLVKQDEVENAQAALDDGRRWLLDMFPVLDRISLEEDEWQSTMNTALVVDAHLRKARQDGENFGGLHDLPAVTAMLHSNLEQLLRPFTGDEVDRSLLEAQYLTTGAATWRTLDAMLSVPLLAGDRRKQVWQALRNLESRLHQEVDQMPVGSLIVRPAPALSKIFPITPPDPMIAGKRQAQLLRLSGTDPAAVDRLEKLLADGASDHRLRCEAAGVLRKTWDHLHAAPVEDGPADLWSWLADWYRYQRREHDPTSPAGQFYARAANAYQDWLPTAEEFAVMHPSVPQAELPPDQTASLQFMVQAAPGRCDLGPLHFLVLTPDETRLEVVPAQWKLEPSALAAGPCSQTCSVRLRPEARADLPPRGVLLQARFQGRAYHAYAELPFRIAGPDILVCPAGKLPTTPSPGIQLRAVRGSQDFSVWLHNAGEHAWPRLAVEVLAEGRLLATATTALAARETQRVPLAPAPSVDASAGKPVADDSGKEVGNRNFVSPLVIRVRDPGKPDVELSSRTVPVTLVRPRDYVELERAEFETKAATGRASARVEVLLRLHQSQGEPPSSAELVLRDGEAESAESSQVRDGTLQGFLPSGGDSLRLYVNNMAMGGLGEGTVRFVVRVDDWQRAFVLRVPLARSGVQSLPQLDERPAVRLALPPWGSATSAFRVPVEVDNPPDGAVLEVVPGRLAGGMFVPEGDAWRGPPWEQRLGWQVQDGGGLSFTAAVQDPVVVLDTTRVRGPREVRARLLDDHGEELACTNRSIVFSDAPPAKPQFEDPPARAWRLAPLRLKARGADPITRIQEVVFFVGEPAGGKLPAGAVTVAARPLNDDRTLWVGDLSLPVDQLGPTSISVQFTNGLGLSQFDTITVTLVENDPQAAMAGRIQGCVLEGTRPQARLDVLLSDDKSVARGKATTAENGRFVLRDVAPGKYRLTCAKSSSQRSGTFPRGLEDFFEVHPGEAIVADIHLFMP